MFAQHAVAQATFTQNAFAQPTCAQPTVAPQAIEQLQSLRDKVPQMTKTQIRDLSKQLDVTQHRKRVDALKAGVSEKLDHLIAKRQRLQ